MHLYDEMMLGVTINTTFRQFLFVVRGFALSSFPLRILFSLTYFVILRPSSLFVVVFFWASLFSMITDFYEDTDSCSYSASGGGGEG